MPHLASTGAGARRRTAEDEEINTPDKEELTAKECKDIYEHIGERKILALNYRDSRYIAFQQTHRGNKERRPVSRRSQRVDYGLLRAQAGIMHLKEND